MKILGNIGLFSFVAASFFGLGDYKRRIDKAAKDGNKEEERKAIYEFSSFLNESDIDSLTRR